MARKASQDDLKRAAGLISMLAHGPDARPALTPRIVDKMPPLIGKRLSGGRIMRARARIADVTPDHRPDTRFKRRLSLAKEYLDVEPIIPVVRSRPQIHSLRELHLKSLV